MFLFDLFRSFLPAANPIGFGASDFFELLLALVLLAGALFTIPYLQPFGLWLAPKTKWCMAVFAILPIVLRLALFAHHPVPVPNVGDEFSHLLVADTLRHFRLANPEHPFHRFFETFFVLQQPTYSSIYPIGQGIPLALGKMIFGLPWAGVLLSTAAFCALCYWMLRGWTTAGWALAGGMLAVFEFGPLCLWMNDYWGGSFAASSGCLVFGALPRLADRGRARDALLLGAGFALHLFTRPFESVMLAASIGLFFGPLLMRQRRVALRKCAIGFAPVVFALLVILLQNRAVTGNWTTLPYALSQQQYGVPVSLTFQADPVPHSALTSQQQNEYEIQRAFKPKDGETLFTYLERLEYRVHYYRFFFLPPLYLALLAFFFLQRTFRWAWIITTLALFSLGSNFFPAFQFHYLAAVTCLFVLVSVNGLERIGRLQIRGLPVGADAARWLLLLCAAHFLFWYTVHLLESTNVGLELVSYDAWNAIDHQFAPRRVSVARKLAAAPGKDLVFVRYYPNHSSADEWVWNEAAIDGARVVWARDLGLEENEKLRAYYRDRRAWLLEPDFKPLPRLTPYGVEKPAEPVTPAEAPAVTRVPALLPSTRWTPSAAPQTRSPFEEPGYAAQ